jgi:hypothetical protein
MTYPAMPPMPPGHMPWVHMPGTLIPIAAAAAAAQQQQQQAQAQATEDARKKRRNHLLMHRR